MAVKVMVAPAIVKRQLELAQARELEAAAGASAEAKPRKRKTAVFDADGNEVFITLVCLKCSKVQPLSAFGLRRMADGAVRNQPWCRPCRSGASLDARKEAKPAKAAKAGKPGKRVKAAKATTAGRPAKQAKAAAPRAADPVPRKGASNLAAQVAAALYAGRK